MEGTIHVMDGASTLLSGLYGVFIELLSLIICTAHYTTGNIMESVVDYYYVSLYFISIVWLISFRTVSTACCRRPTDTRHIKMNHTTNRWLKCILVIFGLAIITKNVMNFLITFQITNSECQKVIFGVFQIVQTVLIVAEVHFLLHYSKLCLQEKKFFDRFGLMHIIVTNLSDWMLTLIEENNEYSDKHSSYAGGIAQREIASFAYSIAQYNLSRPEIEAEIENKTELLIEELGYIDSVEDECVCNTTYCQAVERANSFLYPFAVEFSLITSCMLYIVWKNIGKIPALGGTIVKPTYKFYKSHKGLGAACAVLVGTVLILIILSTTGSTLEEYHKTYDSEINVLIIHNTFLVVVELFMIVSSIACLVLYARTPRPMQNNANLDVVLLIITFVGAVTIDMFYAFAVFAYQLQSTERKWIWGAVYPIIDIFQCVLQVVFILFGLSRKPIFENAEISTEYNFETVLNTISATQNEESVKNVFTNFDNVKEEDGEFTSKDDDDDVCKKACTSKENAKRSSLKKSESKSTSDFSIRIESVKCETSEVFVYDITAPSANTDGSENRYNGTRDDGDQETKIPSNYSSLSSYSESQLNSGYIIKKIAAPDKIRLWVRDLVIFLLAANASLWVFWSLEDTAFDLYPFPPVYYDTNENGIIISNTWMSVNMFCLPLSIFFRMHSCACFFEIWSYG